MNKFKFFIIFIFFLAGCSDAREGFKGKKLDTGEEFLINKKNPLVVPPDFDNLPLPNSSKNNPDVENSEKNLKEILDMDDETNSSNSDNPEKTSNIEESILEKIN